MVVLCAELIWNYLKKKHPSCVQSESIHKQMLVNAALHDFGFDPDDIKDETKFNKREIATMYRRLAKTYHPDRYNKRGSTANADKFREIQAHYGILLAMVEPDNEQENRREITTELIKATSLWVIRTLVIITITTPIFISL